MGKKTDNEIARCTDQDSEAGTFIFNSQDEKGHSSHLRVAVSRDMFMMIAEIIEHGYFPYRTKEDLVRDAIYHRLFFLNDKKDLGLGRELRRMKARQGIIEKYQTEKEHIKWLEQLEIMLGEITDETIRGSLVAEAYEQIVTEPDPYWKQKGLDVLKSRYARYVPEFSLDNRDG